MNFFGSKNNSQDKDKGLLGLGASATTDTPKPDQAKVTNPVNTEPPKYEPPKYEPPKYEPPKLDTPKITTPTPKPEPEITATGLPDMSQTQVSQTQVPQTQTSQTNTSKSKAPKLETPKPETPKLETPKLPSLKPPAAPVAFNGGGTPALLQAGTENRPESEGPKFEDINGNPYTGTDAQAWAEADAFFGRKPAAVPSAEGPPPAPSLAPVPAPAPTLTPAATSDIYRAETIIPLATRMGWSRDQPIPSPKTPPNKLQTTAPTPDEIEAMIPGVTDHQLHLLGAQDFYQQKLTKAQKTGDQAAIDHAALNITGLKERIDVSLSPAQKEAINQKKALADKAKASQVEPPSAAKYDPAHDPALAPTPGPSADEFAGLDSMGNTLPEDDSDTQDASPEVNDAPHEPFEPKAEDLNKYAPERQLTEEQVAKQKETIGQLVGKGDEILQDFYKTEPDIRDENEFIAFDGTQMMHVKDGRVIRAWPSVSGKKGYQNGQHQNLKNLGPIPEGQWSLQQSRHQSYEDVSTWDRMKGSLKLGPWPGRTNSWGENRIWVSGPDGSEKPERLGRSGFSIHGGQDAGSQGCIDATEYMPDFTAYFKKLGRDIPLVVSYPK